LHIPTISTAASVRAIADAKRKGLDVTCSVAIHNLYFTDTVLEQFDSNFKVLPPLRSEADRQALLTGLKDGSIDLLCSDHTPMDLEEKRLEFDRAAFGSLGLEATFGALRTLYPADTCAAILTRGRERFGIKSTAILEGETANITLFNPEGTFTETSDTLNSTSKNSMYIGESLKGIVYGIVVGTKANL
jgi:dihydroorotase